MKKLLLGTTIALLVAAPAGAQDSAVERIRSCVTETVAERGSDRLKDNDVVRGHLVESGETITSICTELMVKSYIDERDAAKASEARMRGELDGANEQLDKAQKALRAMFRPIQLPRTGVAVLDSVEEHVELAAAWAQYHSLTLLAGSSLSVLFTLFMLIQISGLWRVLRALFARIEDHYPGGKKRISGDGVDESLAPNGELQATKPSRWRARPKEKSRIRC